MQNDFTKLEELNIQIGVHESAGKDSDRKWLAKVLAPKLAFRRANLGKTYEDQDSYPPSVKEGGAPRETEIESIYLYGDRAVVTCIVTLTPVGEPVQKFHNVRLWVRHEGEWKLLGWANEPLGTKNP